MYSLLLKGIQSFIILLCNEESKILASICMLKSVVSNYLFKVLVVRHFKFFGWKIVKCGILIFLVSKLFIWIEFISNLLNFFVKFLYDCSLLEDLNVKSQIFKTFLDPMKNLNALPNLVGAWIFYIVDILRRKVCM